MFRVSDLVDLPVKTVKGGMKQKYAVKSVLIDGVNNRAAALVCKEGAIKKYLKIIPYEKIIAIDIDGIIIPDDSCISKISSKDIKNYFQLEDIVNKTVLNLSGNLQGTLTDLYINLLTGKIASIEVSEGYLDDLVRGRRIVSLEHAIKNDISSEGITANLKLY
ncbi:MAG: hypothetical protein K0R84_1689 [Clostridia bacterium]|nr:hypothetical protein [Clostridia bacterium]